MITGYVIFTAIFIFVFGIVVGTMATVAWYERHYVYPLNDPDEIPAGRIREKLRRKKG